MATTGQTPAPPGSGSPLQRGSFGCSHGVSARGPAGPFCARSQTSLVGQAERSLEILGVRAGRHGLIAAGGPLQLVTVGIGAGVQLPVVRGEREQGGQPLLALDVTIEEDE